MRVFCCVRGRYQEGNFNSSFINRVHPLILKLLDCYKAKDTTKKLLMYAHFKSDLNLYNITNGKEGQEQ